MNSELQTCTICLQDIEENGSVTLNCGHQFHLKCFMELQQSNCNNKRKCSNCRQEQNIPLLIDANQQQEQINDARLEEMILHLSRQQHNLQRLERRLDRQQNRLNRERQVLNQNRIQFEQHREEYLQEHFTDIIQNAVQQQLNDILNQEIDRLENERQRIENDRVNINTIIEETVQERLKTEKKKDKKQKDKKPKDKKQKKTMTIEEIIKGMENDFTLKQCLEYLSKNNKKIKKNSLRKKLYKMENTKDIIINKSGRTYVFKINN